MVFNGTKNYYEILGIKPDAAAAEIKTAYRRLARKYHPDINKSADAVEIFKAITTAYETLSNSEKRNNYDIINGIFKQEKSSSAYCGSYRNSQTFQSAQNYKNYQNNADDKRDTKKSGNSSDTDTQSQKTYTKKYSGTKTNNIRPKNYNPGTFFKGIKYFFAKIQKDKREKERKKPQKGQNITTEVTITPEEVINGSKRVVNILTRQTCPECYGHRFVNGGKCTVCSGNGEISKKKRITVTIPKGIKDGAKLRLKGEGGCGKNGGANGDLYIIVHIELPSKIRHDKQNIYYNVPITPYEAALGEEIKIPAFDGIIKLKLPKNTCSGQKFRISGQGIKKNGKTGDLIITVSIEFSHNLSDDEIRLYERLKNLSNDDIRKNLMNEN